MTKKIYATTLLLTLTLLVAGVSFSLFINYASAQSTLTATFDFDSGIPTLSQSQNTPFNQTSNGLTAYFSSPSDPAAFSIQSYESTFFKLSQFSGKYLYDNKPSRDVLDIKFSTPLTSATLTFATLEFDGGTGVEPSNMTLTAYMDSTTASPVGSVTARGTWPNGDSYPQGALAFNAGGQQFNLIRIALPYQGKPAVDFLIDNVIVTASSATSAPTLTPTTAPTAQPSSSSLSPSPSSNPTVISPTPSASPSSTSVPNVTSSPSIDPSHSPTQNLPVASISPAIDPSPSPSPSIPEFPYILIVSLLAVIAAVSILVISLKRLTKVYTP